MGSWLHSTDPSGLHLDLSDLGWRVLKHCSDLSHVLVLDDTYNVDPSSTEAFQAEVAVWE